MCVELVLDTNTTHYLQGMFGRNRMRNAAAPIEKNATS